MSKLVKAIIFLIIFVVLVVILNNLISSYVSQKAANQSGQQIASQQVTQSPAPSSTASAPTAASTPAVSVTTVQAGSIGASLFPTSGTVISDTMISISPTVSGTVKKLNVQEGDFVKAGEVLARISGSNGEPNQVEQQYQIALQNYNFAQQSLANAQSAAQTTLQSAQLQLQNALNQAQSFGTDLSTMDMNINALQQGINLLNNSLTASRQKTSQDLAGAQQSLRDLTSSINQLQTQKQNTIWQIQGAANNGQSADEICLNPSSDLTALCQTYSAQNKSLNDLYASYDKANLGYQDALSASKIADNTTLSQLTQSQNQLNAAVSNKQSAEQKVGYPAQAVAGYDGQSMTAVDLAQKTLEATQKQVQTAQDQAANQVKLAQLNLDMSKSQLDQLTIKAPQDGVIAGLAVKQNDSVNNQTKLFSILTPADFKLDIFVDIDTANQIQPNGKAQVQIANQWVDALVSSVSPIADPKTRLVEVKIALPKIFFRVGQIVQVKLPLQVVSSTPNTLFLPLDAVTIGTHEQFVYIVEHPAGAAVDNDKAKKVDVTTGQIVGDQIQILSGITDGEEVILSGSHDLTDGQVITVSNSN